MDDQTYPKNYNASAPILEASIPIGRLQDDQSFFNLDLTLYERQTIWLLGRSGIGKTTALRTIARLHETPGTVMKYRGKPFDQTGPRQWRSAILYVSQKPLLYRGSVRENIFRPFRLKLHKHRSPEIESVDKLMERLALSNSILERDALTLSVGESARICLIRSLLISPSILLLDEPTASLDLESRKAVAKILKDWMIAGNRGIIGVTHDETLTNIAQGLEIHLDSSEHP